MLVNPDEPHSANSDFPDDLPPDPFGPGDPFSVDEQPTSGPKGAPSTGTGRTGGTGGTGGAGGGQSSADPFAGLMGGAFGGLLGPMLGNFAQSMAKQGPLPWDTVTQIATYTATTVDGTSRPGTVDPLHRIRLEEFVRIAQMHVLDIGGLPVSSPAGVEIRTVTRETWATEFLQRHRAMFEQLGTAIASATVVDPSDVSDPQDELISGLMKMIGPSMLAMQIGAMAGHLAQRCFGNADLPMPEASSGDQLTFITENIAQFANDWSLPLDSLLMPLVIDELVMHAVMRLPHVRLLFSELTTRHALAVRIDVESMSDRLSNLGDPSEMQEALSGAGAMGIQSSPELQRAAHDVTRLVTLIEGWCEHVANRVSRYLLGGDRRAEEALRRRRLDDDAGTDLLASLIGVKLDQAMFDRGAAFINGVFERAGSDGLTKLWVDREHLPTDSELDAPGLWLARLDLATE
jgi:putative hydrolase